MSLNSDTAKIQLLMSGFLGFMGMTFLLGMLYSTLRGGRAINLFLLFASTTLLMAYPIAVGLSLQLSGRSLIYVRRSLAVGIVLSVACLAVAAGPWARASAARSHEVANLLALAVWASAGSWVGVTLLVEGIDFANRHAA